MGTDIGASVAQDPRPGRYRGSEAAVRQVGWAVRLGRRVTAHLPSGHAIEGYVFGSDDYFWLVVGSELDTHVIHKSCSLSFGAESYADEPRHTDLERLVAPYRERVMRTQFGGVGDDSASTT